MFTITEKAAEQFSAAKSGMNEEGLALRLTARRDPVVGIEYNMGFDTAKESDTQYNLLGVDFIVDSETDVNINKTVIDFGPLDGGSDQFIFFNPQDAKETRDAATCSSTPGSSACGTGCSCS